MKYNNKCGCNILPDFVGNDFFCEVAPLIGIVDLNNLLWDGVGCRGGTCCTHNNPPWLHKRLPQPTIDDIEMRMCRNSDRSNEDVLIETIEIYVQ